MKTDALEPKGEKCSGEVEIEGQNSQIQNSEASTAMRMRLRARGFVPAPIIEKWFSSTLSPNSYMHQTTYKTHINKHFFFWEKIYGIINSEAPKLCLKVLWVKSKFDCLSFIWKMTFWCICQWLHSGSANLFIFYLTNTFGAFPICQALCWVQKNFHKCLDGFYLWALLPMVGTKLMPLWWWVSVPAPYKFLCSCY